MKFQSEGGPGDSLEERLAEMAAFVAVVDAGGFSAAARVTRGRKATLSKRLQGLEARLGATLLVRTTRSVRLTEEGQAFLDHARRALAAAREAEAAVTATRATPRGPLKVSLSAALATFAVEAVFVRYLTLYPEVTLHVDTSERLVDPTREAYDLVVRVGAIESSSLIARKLGVAASGFYAHPKYLARRGVPSRPRELIQHDTLCVPKAGHDAEWPVVIKGRTTWFKIRPRLLVTDIDLAVRAAACGLGIVRSPQQLAEPHIKAGRLVQVLSAYTPPPLEVHALFAAGAARSPKLRAFIDVFLEWFGTPKRGGRPETLRRNME